jgi:hypothetical protein
MKTTKIPLAAFLIAFAGAAMAADPPATQTGPKTREQVRAELAAARANGDYDALTMFYVDPFPIDGGRALRSIPR